MPLPNFNSNTNATIVSSNQIDSLQVSALKDPTRLTNTHAILIDKDGVASGSYDTIGGDQYLENLINDLILKIYKKRFIQNLVVGANIIMHNMNLISPFGVIVQVRDDSTGSEIPIRVVSETANTVTINSPIAYANARITII